MKYYLDSNIFVYAAIYTDRRAEAARKLLKQVVDGDLVACTCALALDEVMWSIQKLTRKRLLALEAWERILSFPSLQILDINTLILQRALNLMKQYPHLDPRDAIHTSAAIENHAGVIVSEDSDLDIIREIKRKGLE